MWQLTRRFGVIELSAWADGRRILRSVRPLRVASGSRMARVLSTRVASSASPSSPSPEVSAQPSPSHSQAHLPASHPNPRPHIPKRHIRERTSPPNPNPHHRHHPDLAPTTITPSRFRDLPRPSTLRTRRCPRRLTLVLLLTPPRPRRCPRRLLSRVPQRA